MDRFVNDESPEAIVRLIDHNLSSLQYGERWARHWLDLAGYADSEGYTPEDVVRPHAWQYRDYVIRSINEGKPFDQFIVEQLAGDELITSPLNELSSQDAELLIATGFLRMAPDGTGSNVDDANVARNSVIADTVKIVTSTLMGVTVECAQCHDHRFDPISQVDYYRLRAIFDPALNWKQWKSPSQRLISLYTSRDRAQAVEVEARAKAVEDDRKKKQDEFIAQTFTNQLAKLPGELQESARAAFETPEKERTAEQKAILKTHPSLNVSAGSLYLYNKKAADELQAMADEAKRIRSEKPPERFVRALTERNEEPPKSFLFSRGDHDQPQTEVAPAGLTVVSMNQDLPPIPVRQKDLSTSGRRLAFAKRLTDPGHPLTARVIVNRIWLAHFGVGLVATPADFGFQGALPTHPKLLDWLASEFIESGWSMKHLHRLILNSRTYQQSIHRAAILREADPENRLYGGMNLRRHDAETIRDSILFISGRLSDQMYGEPVPVMADNSGRWILGIENLSAGRPGKVIPLNGQEYRRSIYVQSRRSRPLAAMEPFDLPRMTPNCTQRRHSTVAPQSLMLLNSQFIIEYADKTGERLMQSHRDDKSAQVTKAWELTYGRQPSASEFASAISFLEEQAELLRERIGRDEPASALTQKALSSLCQMLFSSNEFLYVD